MKIERSTTIGQITCRVKMNGVFAIKQNAVCMKRDYADVYCEMLFSNH
jgi:limonene-1,2-epoxide hydrolase